jgi:RiboL-PSP-HEPN
MAIATITHKPNKPKSDILQNAYIILCSSHKASESFLDEFKESRKGCRGAPTDIQQDLLRAMLVFASSGLDSMVKQLVRDALPQIIEKDDGAMLMFSGQVEKAIYKGQNLNATLLTKAILSDSPRNTLIENLVSELTANSLQSAEELFRVGSYFNIASKDLTSDIDGLKTIFRVRNQISHEMDINFNQPNRSRYPRKRDEMISYTNELFKVSNSFLQQVAKKLQ